MNIKIWFSNVGSYPCILEKGSVDWGRKLTRERVRRTYSEYFSKNQKSPELITVSPYIP